MTATTAVHAVQRRSFGFDSRKMLRSFSSSEWSWSAIAVMCLCPKFMPFKTLMCRFPFYLLLKSKTLWKKCVRGKRVFQHHKFQCFLFHTTVLETPFFNLGAVAGDASRLGRFCLCSEASSASMRSSLEGSCFWGGEHLNCAALFWWSRIAEIERKRAKSADSNGRLNLGLQLY